MPAEVVLKPPAPAKTRAWVAADLAGVHQQRRPAAHAPGAAVLGIEGAALGGAVLIHAVRLADDEAAIGRVRAGEQLAGRGAW